MDTIGIDYESFTINIMISLFYIIEYHFDKGIQYYLLHYSLISKGVSMTKFLTGINCKNNNYLMRRYFSPSIGLNNNIIQNIAIINTSFVCSIDQNLCNGIPEKNKLINKIIPNPDKSNRLNNIKTHQKNFKSLKNPINLENSIKK
jgi:hypothetical protein